MSSEYHIDFIHDEDARGENISDEENNEPLDYQDWSTIYSDELWDMWYLMKEYLDNRYIFNELFENIDPDDFFSDFCYDFVHDFQVTTHYDMWKNENLNDLSYLWHLIKDYYKIFGSRTFDEFCLFIYTSKKYHRDIYNERSSRYHSSQGRNSSRPFSFLEPRFSHFR